MAGRHNGNGASGSALSLGNQPPFYPGSKLDRAYSEGRGSGIAGANPHPVGSPEYAVWNVGAINAGLSAEQLQTCWGQSFAPYNVTAGTEIDVSPAMGDWIAIGTPDIAATVSDPTIGGTGIRLHKASGLAGVYRDFSPNIPLVDENDTLAIWIYVDFPITFSLQSVVVDVRHVAGGGQTIVTNTRDGLRRGWNCLRLPAFDRFSSIPGARPATAGNASMNCWTSYGTGFDPSQGIQRLTVRVENTTSYGTTNRIIFGGATLGYRIDTPVLMWGFDDGYNDMLDVVVDIGDGRGPLSTFQRSQLLNFPMSVAITRDRIDTAGFLTTAEIAQLRNGGWEIHVHGEAEVSSSVFSSEALALSDGFPDGPFIEGDSMRYNQRYLTANGFTGAEDMYVYPGGNNRSSGQTWQENLTALAAPYFTSLAATTPGFQTYDFLPTIGDQKPGWDTFGRMSLDNKTLFPSYLSVRNSMIQDSIIAEKQSAWLLNHRLTTGGTQTAPPVTALTYYAEDLAFLMNFAADERDAGRLFLEPPKKYYSRMLATGAPVGF